MKHSLGGEQHAAPCRQLVRLALPAQILGCGSGWKLCLAHVTKVSRQMDGLTWRKRRRRKRKSEKN